MTEITGRDKSIMCKALAYAIESIDRLPLSWQERSDCDDMVRLLDAIAGPKGAEFYRTGARSHLERRGVKVVAGHMELADRPEGVVIDFPGDDEGGER